MTDLENALITVFASITGLKDSDGSIRLAYEDNSAPSWSHTEDVLTFYLTPVSASIDQDYGEELINKVNTHLFTRKTYQTQVVEANLSFYGPHCRELANKLRVLIQKDDLRRPLTTIKAFPVLKTPPARYVPYEHNKQWWQRADMTLTFNWQTILTEEVNKIESANIIIKTEKGEIRNVDITPNTGS